jgi:ribonuclease HI
MKDIIIFSDGSSRGNPGPGGWGAIISLKGKVAELGGCVPHTTNNRMELLAAINALSKIKDKKTEIFLNSDSSYVINGITKWVNGWQKNGWITSTKEEVINRDLWEKLIKVTQGKKIKWNYVGGHIGILGNERCDEIATAFADKGKIKLFNGKISNYRYNLFDMKGSHIKATKKSKSKGPAYSYLSLVHGVLKIDKTWAECEKRVRGIKGDVKFKKAVSFEDEKNILKEWLNQSIKK